ncbi:MAG TPA: pirin family protein [Phycisphaerales bacterium]|nr:pirin family protein [Phycisphaerales bacterium]
MITVRPSSERGHFDHGWLNTFHTFSFGGYHDPKNMHFRSLRVINEDVVAPGRGFGKHPHDNMEILTWVLSGSLAHSDSLGSERSLRHGELQRMSAGTGIEHAEYNGSKTEPVHLLQVWILPKERHAPPRYDQKEFPAEGRRNRLQLLASPEAADGSLSIGQDARMHVSEIDAGKSVKAEFAPERNVWVQVARGSVSVNGTALAQGDGAAITGETALEITADENAEVIVFDLA